MGSDAEAIWCGEFVIGYVTLTGADMFWLLGTFRPTAQFEPHRHLFERQLQLSESSDDSDNDRADELLDEINALDLRVGESKDPIGYFKLTAPGEVEFKKGAPSGRLSAAASC